MGNASPIQSSSVIGKNNQIAFFTSLQGQIDDPQ